MLRSTINAQRGFTLIELVMVMIIIGTLAAVVMNRFSVSGYAASAAQGELRSAIRYAQEKSMSNTGAIAYQVSINASGYSVTQGGAAITHPVTGVSGYTNSWADVAISPTGTIQFDGYGQPTIIAGGLAFAGNQEVIAVTSGGDARSITIEQLTGYVR